MTAKFKQGDLVELRSGGPVMTVYGYRDILRGLDHIEAVECEWFLNGEVKRETFAESQLALVEAFVVPVTQFRRAIQ